MYIYTQFVTVNVCNILVVEWSLHRMFWSHKHYENIRLWGLCPLTPFDSYVLCFGGINLSRDKIFKIVESGRTPNDIS